MTVKGVISELTENDHPTAVMQLCSKFQLYVYLSSCFTAEGHTVRDYSDYYNTKEYYAAKEAVGIDRNRDKRVHI